LDKEIRKQRLFQVLTEIGIIQQLSATVFNRQLPEGLHISHFGVINHLCRLGDSRTPVELASSFQVTKPTMTNTLTKLSARGLIEIRNNPDDGRSKLVFLTPEGRTFRDRSIAALEPFMARMDQEFDLEKLMDIQPVLQELREYLDNNR